MSELRLKSTGTIKLFENDNTSSVTIASPASLGGDRTITLPDASVTLASGTMLATDGDGSSLSGVGKVLQVINGTTVTAASSTSSTFADTGCTASITCSSTSNKVAVFATVGGIGQSSDNGSLRGVNLKLLRDSTALIATKVGEAIADSRNTDGSTAELSYVGGQSINYLDSPSSTGSALTYKTQFCNNNAVGTVYVQSGGGNASTIILMEIAG